MTTTTMLIEVLAWVAAALTLATFVCRDMLRLRLPALAANMAFIGHGLGAVLRPVATLRAAQLGALCALLVLPVGTALAASDGERVFDGALQSLRSGRTAEAYGRFIGLAEAGHPASARYAIYMCLHGPQAFGKDFDCAQQELDDWAQVAGLPAPSLKARVYAPPAAVRKTGQR
jgi:hypothetical protein